MIRWNVSKSNEPINREQAIADLRYRQDSFAN